MTDRTSQTWGELRSMLNLSHIAGRTRWQALLEHVARFAQGDERDAAAHYAATSLRAMPKKWPASACTWRYTHRERTPPEPWQMPLIKGVEFDTISTPFVSEAIEQLRGLSLECLSLEWFEMTAAALHKLLNAPALRTLRALHIKNYDSSSRRKPSVMALDGLDLLAQLDTLTLRHVEDEGSRATGEVLGQCHQLKHLGIHGGMYDRASWKHLFAHTTTPIPSFDFSGSYMGAAAINVMIRTQMIDEVEVLYAIGCESGSAGLKALSKANNHVLRDLNLSSTELGAAGLAALEHALFLPSLRCLRLEGNSLRPLGKSLHLLRDVGLCTQLEVLGLGSTGVGTKTCAPLFEQEMPHLHTLQLGNNGLKDPGLDVLRGCAMPNLTHLDVHWNQLSDEALMRLTDTDWPKLERVRIDQYQRAIAPDVIDALREKWGDDVVWEQD